VCSTVRIAAASPRTNARCATAAEAPISQGYSSAKVTSSELHQQDTLASDWCTAFLRNKTGHGPSTF
jgi:hypothetical protein